jgi:hypothetical protein
VKKLICAAALAAFAAVAEDKPKAPDMPKPPPEMAVEQWFVGNWTCKGHQNAGPMGPAMNTHETIAFKMELGGFWLQYKGTGHVGPMKGKEMFDGFSSWDGTTHQRFDFMPGGMAHYTTKGWEGDALNFDGELMLGGQKIAAKETITRKGDGTFMTSLLLAGADGKMSPMLEETCTKGGAAQAQK